MEDTAMRSGSYPLIDDGLYKVLLVDDEEVVRHGLRYMLDWKTLGFRMIKRVFYNLRHVGGKYSLWKRLLFGCKRFELCPGKTKFTRFSSRAKFTWPQALKSYPVKSL